MSDQLAGVELRHHTFEDFVNDGGENSFVIVCAECAVDLWERVNARTREYTTGDVNHLQVFSTGQGGHVARFGTDIVRYGCFEPGDFEVGSCVHHEQRVERPWSVDNGLYTFIVDLLLNTAYSCVFDCSVATVNYPTYLATRVSASQAANIPLKRALFTTNAPPPSTNRRPTPPNRFLGFPPRPFRPCCCALDSVCCNLRHVSPGSDIFSRVRRRGSRTLQGQSKVASVILAVDGGLGMDVAVHFLVNVSPFSVRQTTKAHVAISRVLKHHPYSISTFGFYKESFEQLEACFYTPVKSGYRL